MDEQIKRDFWNPEQLKALKDQKFIVVGEVKWNRGELLEKIQAKQAEFECMDIKPIYAVPDDHLDLFQRHLDNMIRKMAEDQEMFIICELAKRYIEDERHHRDIVHCMDCLNLSEKTLPSGRVVNHCPLMVGDVQPVDGFCHNGIGRAKHAKIC